MQALLTCIALAVLGAVCIQCEVLRPCGSDPADRDCVSRELSLRSRCTPIANGPNFNPYYLDRLPIEAPAFNMSQVKSNLLIVGLNETYIKDFVIDEDNGYTLIVLNHTNAYFQGNITVFFYETGESPIAVDSYFYNYFYNFMTTTMLPGTTSLDMKNALTYGEHTIIPELDMGDGLRSAMEIYDRVNRILTAAREEFSLLMTEEGVTVAPTFAKAFIDQNICSYDEITRWPMAE